MRSAGLLLVAAALAAACSELSPGASGLPAAPPPPPPTPHSAWTLALQLSGDVQGTMSEVAPAGRAPASECTGRNSRRAEAWASTMYGPVGQAIYGVVVAVPAYRGPGVYRAPAVTVQVVRQDIPGVWQTQPGDLVAFTVAPDEESGSLDATLTDLASDATKLHLTGRWSCIT